MVDKAKGGNDLINKAVTVDGKTERVSKVEETAPPASHINCSNCKKNVPELNFELHQVRCATQLLKEQKDKAEVDYFNSLQSQADLESSKSKATETFFYNSTVLPKNSLPLGFPIIIILVQREPKCLFFL